jgi:hypothetical protein
MNEATQPVKGRGMVLTAVAVAVVVIGAVILSPFASAASNPVATPATTTITLNSGFANKLKKSKVKLTGLSPAKVKGKTVTLPVEEGSVEPTGAGALHHEGGLKFKVGKKSVTIKGLEINTTTNALSGKLGGKTMKIATDAPMVATREGFGVSIAIGSMKLTGKAAKQLNKKLGFTGKKKKGKKKPPKPPFKGNQVIGKSVSPTQPKTIGVLPQGAAKLEGNLATLIKFVELGVEIEGIAPTTKEGLATFVFPLSGGNIAPNGLAGVPQSAGGVKFTQEPVAGVHVFLTLSNVWIDLATKKATAEVAIEDDAGEAVKTPGKLGRVSIADLKTEGATITSDPNARTVTVTGAAAVLQGTTAFTLNETFAGGKEKFKEGDVLGNFSFTATTE